MLFYDFQHSLKPFRAILSFSDLVLRCFISRIIENLQRFGQKLSKLINQSFSNCQQIIDTEIRLPEVIGDLKE